MQTSIEKDQTWRSFNIILITSGTLFPAILMFTVSQLSPDQKYIIIGLITIGYALCEVTWMGGISWD
jgi:hypothetical protein